MNSKRICGGLLKREQARINGNLRYRCRYCGGPTSSRDGICQKCAESFV